MTADERHKDYTALYLFFYSCFFFIVKMQFLIRPVAHWNDHPAAHGELIEQDFGNDRSPGSDDDPVERRMLNPSGSAVTLFEGDVVEFHFSQPFSRGICKFALPFNRIHPPGEVSQYRRLESRSCTDFEYFIILAQLEQLRHERNNVRL